MKVSRPLSISLPPGGVCFAESVHAQDFAMRTRGDPYHKLLYVLRGCVRYSEEGRPPETLRPGTLLPVPRGARHAISDEHASTLLLLCVAESFLAGEGDLLAAWEELIARERRQIAVDGPMREALENCWRRALLERAHPRPAGAAAAKALALQVFVHLARVPAASPAESATSRVMDVARAMEETFFEHWSLDGAAERAGMSRRHFSANFRAAFERTFWEYLTEVRLVHAARLLRQGEHSVTGVIFACGFGDVTQFYRLFRKRYGKPPKAWASGTADVFNR